MSMHNCSVGLDCSQEDINPVRVEVMGSSDSQPNEFAADLEWSVRVLQQGYPNVYGAKTPIPTHLNLVIFESILEGYHDMEVIQFLKYGWPANGMPGAPPPTVNSCNHLSALRHPDFVDTYISNEIEHGATMGPFTSIPFQAGATVSPLSTRPKCDVNSRCAILDLSFPQGGSVNDYTPKDTYLGINVELKFPGVDALAEHMKQLGCSCRMWKHDVSRCFHQFGLDPADYRLFGYLWRGLYYFVLAVGYRIAPYICQRVTDAVSFVHCRVGMFLLNYVDDFLGAEHYAQAQAAYDRLGKILEEINLTENQNKAVLPTDVIEFLGVTFNSVTGTMEVLEHRLHELHDLLEVWSCKLNYTRKELESLVGKLQFVAACVWPGRVFICRLLNAMRETNRLGTHPVPFQVKQDMHWWLLFLPHYNGVSIAWMDQFPTPDSVVSCDASLQGIGAYLTGLEYLTLRVPGAWGDVNIAYLEMWAVIITLRAWGSSEGKESHIAVR